jgi:hypothetical protein
MFASASVPAPELPYGYLLEILFAAILAVSLVLAVKYHSFGKRWSFLLFVVGIVEYEFSLNTPHNYSPLAVGILIGIVTTFSGLIIPALYLAKPHLHKKQVKISGILSGCLELILGAVGFCYLSNFGIYLGNAPIMVQIFLVQIVWFVVFGLFTIAFYSLIVGVASLFYAKPKPAAYEGSNPSVGLISTGVVSKQAQQKIGPPTSSKLKLCVTR